MNYRDLLETCKPVWNGQLSPHPDGTAHAYIPTSYKENHAPSVIQLQNGDLLAVWFAGSTEEGRSDIRIVSSRLVYGDDRWSEPVTVSNDELKSEQNPVLFQEPNGRLLVFYTAQDPVSISREEFQKQRQRGAYTKQETAVIRCRHSQDNGFTWSEAQIFSDTPGSFCRAPIVQLSNGDWLFPMWYSLADGETVYGNDYSVVRISSDHGRSWKEYPFPESRGRVHASVIELSPGRLVAFFRSRAADRIYISRSTDYGRTWTPIVPTVLPNNNASIRAILLNNGKIAMIFNHFSANEDPALTVWPKERYPLTIAISGDEGNTWPYMRHLDTGDNYCGHNRQRNRRYEYPWILQSKDGLLHALYAYGSRQGIKHVILTEDWIIGS